MTDELKAEREDFEKWMETLNGFPFARQFSNFMWQAWKERAKLARTHSAAKGGAVAWQYREVTEDGPSPVWDEASRMHFEILRNDRRYEVRELYTHPASPDVVRDAERYRWLRNEAIHYENQDTRTPWVFNAKNVADYDGWPVWGQELDNLVDAAMADREGGE